MRGFDIAMTAFALSASRPRPPTHETMLAPAIDEPDAAWLNRAALPQQRAALVASLWPSRAGQCVARAEFVQFAAPAMFGALFRVGWAGVAEARALTPPGPKADVTHVIAFAA